MLYDALQVFTKIGKVYNMYVLNMSSLLFDILCEYKRVTKCCISKFRENLVKYSTLQIRDNSQNRVQESFRKRIPMG